MKLKILTQNLHCLVEKNLLTKQHILANKIAELDIDIVFLQEVAQTKTPHHPSKTSVADDNYGLVLQKLLKHKGLQYHFYFEPIKESFSIYDEGVAILSKYPLEYVEAKVISKTNDYSNWKTRKALVYKLSLNHKTLALATTHFGWSDEVETFEDQFDLINETLIKEDLAILAGDYNIYPESKEYKHIIKRGWLDVFKDDKVYIQKPTFSGEDNTHFQKIRIDYIMTNKPVTLVDKEILFTKDRISDHYGVFVEISI